MILKMKFISSLIFFAFFICNIAFSEKIEKIVIIGNERIPDQTIIMFSDVEINDDINQDKLNDIINNLYDTSFFKTISTTIKNNTLQINVVEFPIIEKIEIKGLKAKKIKDEILSNLKLKSRSSYNEFQLSEEKKTIDIILKDKGYYFSSIETYINNLGDNKISITYEIDLGEKASIKKITFIGDKVFKDRKLKSLIASEEYKFWKFISQKKFLNEELISLDERLLKNFYLNNGYYDVQINTSFAKMVNNQNFELIFNIDANKKYYFGDLVLKLPTDFEKNNFVQLNELFEKIRGKPYSINSVKKILDKIDLVTINEEYKSLSAEVNEEVTSNKINLTFIIEEGQKYIVEKINIFGNNVTQESVIRNQLEIDEGDVYNEILQKKSENNLKSLNFFKNVTSKIYDGKKTNSKIIDITISEKPTGEISAGAGVGTSGGTVAVGVKENNYLGRGLAVDANATITSETFKGMFSVTNPNYNNSDKAVFANIQAIETDQLNAFGYKTNKTGFEVGTKFEFLEDLKFGVSSSTFYEKIETGANASERQKKQKGDYFDNFIKFNFDYDKRNQKFKTTEGFRSNYFLSTPIVSETNTLTTSYDYKIFTELYEKNVSSFSIFFQTANSITGDDIKLSERLTIPSKKLRGFERGRVGPKDGNDFIGGNHVSAVNFTSTLPQLFPNAQNLDVSFFFDAANLWGVDYDSSLDVNNKIRSSVGIGVDWFTIIGPLNFSLSETLTKEDTDVTESFRFNIGTTF